MSDNLEHENPTDALATRSTAADWLVSRRMSENWTKADQAELDRWLAQSSANRIAYWRLDGAWGQAKRLTALRQPMRPPAPINRGRNRGLRFAAVFGVAAVIGVVGSQYAGGDNIRTYTTPVGGHLTVSLADGSKIELNTDSVLRVSAQGGKRFAALARGEAFFQIEHDPVHPFVVSVGKQRIIDLGTKFSVRKNAATVRVSLIEGSAKIEPSDGHVDQAKILEPGDVAVASANAIDVTKSPVSNLNEDLAWRRGMIAFKRATLADAASEFNRYNRTKIAITDPGIARLTIHGTFPAQDVWAFADVAQAYFHLRAEKRNGVIVISR